MRNVRYWKASGFNMCASHFVLSNRYRRNDLPPRPRTPNYARLGPLSFMCDQLSTQLSCAFPNVEISLALPGYWFRLRLGKPRATHSDATIGAKILEQGNKQKVKFDQG